MLLASGGFAHNPSMCQKYSADQPNEGKWSLSNPGDTGEVLQTLIDRGVARRTIPGWPFRRSCPRRHSPTMF